MYECSFLFTFLDPKRPISTKISLTNPWNFIVSDYVCIYIGMVVSKFSCNNLQNPTSAHVKSVYCILFWIQGKPSHLTQHGTIQKYSLSVIFKHWLLWQDCRNLYIIHYSLESISKSNQLSYSTYIATMTIMLNKICSSHLLFHRTVTFIFDL